MKSRIIYSTIFLFFILSECLAQDKKPDMSNPIEFTGPGWNKVLCMKNGNTLLFHFDPTKPVVVNVFDSSHKRIATQEYLCSVMDINALRTSIFKGIFDINGEAVLFIEQEHLSRYELVRMRFNGSNGKLMEEKVAGESPSIAKKTKFYVMKNKEEDSYAILSSTDEPLFYKTDNHVTYYNGRHEAIREVPLEVERKNYDYLEVACAESKPNGILVALNLRKLIENKTQSSVNPQSAVYDHHVAIYYIPRDSSKAKKRVVDISTDAYPYYSDYTYNVFAKTLNLLVFSYRELFYKFGIDIRRGSVSGDMFFKMEEDNSDIKFNWVKNDLASASLQQKTDTSKVFYGMPLGMFTNENGLTTVISETYERYDEPESGGVITSRNRVRNQGVLSSHEGYEDPESDESIIHIDNESSIANGRTRYGEAGRYDFNTYYGNIGITQIDDDGNELWGTVLPHSEYLKSYRHYYHPKEVAKKNQTHTLFDDLPEQVTERQFVSLNSYSYKNNLYIVFNDDNRNFKRPDNAHGDTVFNFENTNACYYKMNGKREITKNFLFGEPERNEYKCSFIEGADFDEKRGVYATLVQYKRNDNITLRMAWGRLE